MVFARALPRRDAVRRTGLAAYLQYHDLKSVGPQHLSLDIRKTNKQPTIAKNCVPSFLSAIRNRLPTIIFSNDTKFNRAGVRVMVGAVSKN